MLSPARSLLALRDLGRNHRVVHVVGILLKDDTGSETIVPPCLNRRSTPPLGRQGSSKFDALLSGRKLIPIGFNAGKIAPPRFFAPNFTALDLQLSVCGRLGACLQTMERPGHSALPLPEASVPRPIGRIMSGLRLQVASTNAAKARMAPAHTNYGERTLPQSNRGPHYPALTGRH